MEGTGSCFTTRDAARITGLSPARVRAFARAGLLSTAVRFWGRYRYSFHDLLLLKRTKHLLDAGISPRRVRRALRSLQRAAGRHDLARFRLGSDGTDVLVVQGGKAWHPESGQLELQLPVRGARAQVRPLPVRSARGTLNADHWYDLGVELEASSPVQAMEAYRRALEQDPDFAEAHVNLGRLLHLAGKLHLARAHYVRAMQLDPLDPVPLYNLGVVLEDLGEAEQAVEMYQRALRRDPGLADAHYNLALLYERRGRRAEAERHMQAYRRLTDPGCGGVQ